MPSDRFLPDGQDRALDDPKFQSNLKAAIAALQARYEVACVSASWFRRLLLRYQLKREIRLEIERHAPSDALYFLAQSPQPRRPAA
jgi:hypothetical protein